jgi:arsenate reductase
MKIIFLCTANSCRSQMAEAWARSVFPEDWTVASAGLITYPITEATRRTMAEVGLDMEGQHTQSIDQYDLNDFDLVVTLSGQSTKFLPRLQNPESHRAHPMSDPMSASGSEEEVRQAFAVGRDRIGELVKNLVTENTTG